CAVRATGSLKSSARTVAPTRAPAMRVPYPWIEVALCGLPPAVVGAPKGASHAETSAAARVVRGRRETSKILANGGVCAGASIAGPIGTGASAVRGSSQQHCLHVGRQLLVSVRKHFESFESLVIQSGDLIREGHHRCGRRRTADVTTAANCDIRVT